MHTYIYIYIYVYYAHICIHIYIYVYLNPTSLTLILQPRNPMPEAILGLSGLLGDFVAAEFMRLLVFRG